MEIDAAFSLWADFAPKLMKRTETLLGRTEKPIHRPVFGNLIQVSGVQLLETTDAVDAGRVWNVLKIGLFGNDGHTALSTVPAVSQPAMPASTVAAQNLNLFPVQVVISAGTLTAVTVNGINVGSGDGTYIVPSGGAISVTYTIAPTWVWTALTSVPAVADVYASSGGSVDPDFSAQILSGAAIPSVSFPPDEAEWMHYGEKLVAWIYGLPANSSVSFVAKIADYPVEAVEAMRI